MDRIDGRKQVVKEEGRGENMDRVRCEVRGGDNEWEDRWEETRGERRGEGREYRQG
jgi:hypothetical protein